MVEGLAINTGRAIGRFVHVSRLKDIRRISLKDKIVLTENKLLFPYLIKNMPSGIILTCGGVISHVASAYAGLPVLISMVHKRHISSLYEMLGKMVQISNNSNDLSVISNDLLSDNLFSQIKFNCPIWINVSNYKQLSDSPISYDGIGIVRIENIFIDKYYSAFHKAVFPAKIKERSLIFLELLKAPEKTEVLLDEIIKEIETIASCMHTKPVRVRLPDFALQNKHRGASLLIDERYISFTKLLLKKLVKLSLNHSNLELIFPYVKDIEEYKLLSDLCKSLKWNGKISLMIENINILEEYKALPLQHISSFIIGLGDLTSEVFNIIRDDSFYFFNNPLFEDLMISIKKIILFCKSNNISVQIGGLPTSYLNKLESNFMINPSGWLLRPDLNHFKYINT